MINRLCNPRLELYLTEEKDSRASSRLRHLISIFESLDLVLDLINKRLRTSVLASFSSAGPSRTSGWWMVSNFYATFLTIVAQPSNQASSSPNKKSFHTRYQSFGGKKGYRIGAGIECAIVHFGLQKYNYRDCFVLIGVLHLAFLFTGVFLNQVIRTVVYFGTTQRTKC